MDELTAIYEAMRCPVCGLQLDFKPWNGDSPSDEICPQCGMQFGYYDVGPGDRREYYEQWRDSWARATKTSNQAPQQQGACRLSQDWSARLG